MSRVKHLKKNIRVNLIFYILYTLVGFFSRKIFLEYLGDEFMGLIGTLQSILGFLNLAELGIGTAIGFSLYKPIYDNDRVALSKIISLLGYLYKRIALIILGIAIICSLFFGYFFEDTSFSLALILYCFFGFLFSSLLGYLYNFHQSLLQADQKEYLVTSYLQSTNIIRQILQAAVAYYYGNPYLWITLEIFFSVIYSIIIRKVLKKQYGWLEFNQKTTSDIIKDSKIIITKIKQVFVHKIASFITYGTDQILIYVFVSIQSVAFFGNYNLIFTMLQNLVNKLFSGINAGIGNLIAENNPKQIEKVFWEMMTLRFIIAGITALNLYFLIDNFIFIWLGEKYLLGANIIAIMTFNYFIMVVRLPIDSFINAYGLYKDTWAPIVEIILNLILSIVLGKIWGIFGIILATAISVTSIMLLWKPYYLYSSGFKQNPIKTFWPHFLKLIIAFVIPLYIIKVVQHIILESNPQNYIEWITKAIILNLVILVTFIPFMFFLGKGFKDLTNRLLFKGK